MSVVDYGSGYLQVDTRNRSGASGWTVTRDGDEWTWSAYGPGGTEHGRATSKPGAEQVAQQARTRLKSGGAR